MATYAVTGATGGIGRVLAEELAGDDLVLVGRSAESLGALCDGLPSARPVIADLAAPDGLVLALERAGVPERLDGLVHVGGTSINRSISESTPSAWYEQLAVNLVAVAELTRLLLPALRLAGGTVVILNSGAGKAVRGPGRSLYSASKHALVAFADGLRLEEPRIRVVSIFPGRVATEMQQRLRAYEGKTFIPEDYIDPKTVVDVIVTALRFPSDAGMDEVVLMPRSRG